MPIQVLMPALSPTMTEGNLARWLKSEGDSISPGDVIAEIETDKATMEVEAIDEGIPLAWALMLGLYPEDGKTPQTGGGHMRTIIGYNKEKDSIIFTDTWGAGHEKKYMKFDDSFAASWVVWKISPK